MGPRSSIVIVSAIAICVLIVATAGLPVPIGVVTSGSMNPTLDRGDVYLALPVQVVGGVDTGDIAVFHGRSGWTVHRVVADTPDGFVTKGDGTPLTDQDDGSPPIPPGSVVGVVPEPWGRSLAVPGVLGGEPAVRTAVLCAGLLVVSSVLETDHADWVPSPPAIGGLVAMAVVLSWLLGPMRPTPASAGSLFNSGYVPFVVIRDLGGSTLAVDLLWPGAAVDLRASERHASLFGVAPPSLVAFAVERDVRIAVALASSTTGAIAWAVASMTARLLPPERA